MYLPSSRKKCDYLRLVCLSGIGFTIKNSLFLSFARLNTVFAIRAGNVHMLWIMHANFQVNVSTKQNDGNK